MLMKSLAMPRIIDRLGFAVAGALAIVLVAALAGMAGAGPLEPTGAPSTPTDSVRLPGTPISSVPFTINQPGHYYVTRDLSISGATAITVNVSDVSIDLGGFTLSGNDSSIADGVDKGPGGTSRLRVYNGTIRDFKIGIDFSTVSDARVHDVTLISNETGASLGAANVLNDCVVSQNGFGVFVSGDSTAIRDCNINTNAVYGIGMAASPSSGLIEGTSLFSNNTLQSATGGGVRVEGNRLTIRDSEFGLNAVQDVILAGAAGGDDVIIIDNGLSCSNRITIQPGADNTYRPTNNTEPHTNRSHQNLC